MKSIVMKRIDLVMIFPEMITFRTSMVQKGRDNSRELSLHMIITFGFGKLNPDQFFGYFV